MPFDTAALLRHAASFLPLLCQVVQTVDGIRQKRLGNSDLVVSEAGSKGSRSIKQRIFDCHVEAVSLDRSHHHATWVLL